MDNEYYTLSLSIHRYAETYQIEISHSDPNSDARVSPLRGGAAFDMAATKKPKLGRLLVLAGVHLRERDEDPHRMLAELPASVYVTINFDPLLEWSLRANDRTPQQVLTRWRYQKLPQSVEGQTIAAPTANAVLDPQKVQRHPLLALLTVDPVQIDGDTFNGQVATRRVEQSLLELAVGQHARLLPGHPVLAGTTEVVADRALGHQVLAEIPTSQAWTLTLRRWTGSLWMPCALTIECLP